MSGRRTVMRRVIVLGWLVSGFGCHVGLPRMAGRGEWEEVVRHVAKRRVEPRRRAARAYATALEHRGDAARARGVLLRDFRRSDGDSASLLALAELESRQGWLASAAAHYALLADLDPQRARGHVGACAVWEQRARAELAAGDPDAAWYDAVRLRKWCPTPTPEPRARLEAETRAAAAARARAMRPEVACSGATCRVAGSSTIAPGTAAPVAARWEASRRAREALPPTDLPELLLAEARGELGAATVLPADSIRAALGEASWVELEPLVAARAPGEGAYLRLRLAGVIALPGEDAPRGGGAPRLDEARVDAARVVEAAARGELGRGAAWRAFLVAGDASSAELTLGTDLRARARPAGGPVAPGATGPVEGALGSSGPLPALLLPEWMSRLPDDVVTRDEVRAWAALRDIAKRPDTSLAALRWVLERSVLRGDADADATVALEAARALRWGRPLRALLLAETSPGPAARAVARAALAAVRVTAILCDQDCGDDPEVAHLRAVVDDGWIASARERSRELGRRPPEVAGAGASSHACPGVEAVLAAHPTLAPASALGVGAPARGAALASVLESDPGLVCLGRLVVEVLAREGHRATALELSDLLAHGPTTWGAAQLEVMAKLALVGGDPRRAEAMATRAAARSTDPSAVWLRIADAADAAGAAELLRRALRRALQHRPERTADELHLRLLVSMLADVLPDGPPAVGLVEAAAIAVNEYVGARGPAGRWKRRDDLVWALLRRHGTAPLRRGAPDPAWDRLTEVVLPPTVRGAHAHALEAMEIRAGAAVEPRARVPEHDLTGATAVLRARAASVPRGLEWWADGVDDDDLRAVWAERAQEPRARAAAAAATILVGADASRRRAILRELAALGRRPAIQRQLARFLLGAPPALDGHGHATSVFRSDADALATLLPYLGGDPAEVR